MGRREANQGGSTCRGGTASQNRTNIGCMSGILRLLSRHHRHSRKRLSTCPAPKKDVSLNISFSALKHAKLPSNESAKFGDPYHRRSSCDMPRSPTIPLELRRCSNGSLDSPRGSSAIVARLMGLDVAAPQTAAPESSAEKRRRLMSALEKCDDDLKTLRRIIEAVRVTEIRIGMETVGPGAEKRMGGGDLIRKEMEHPSPNSVLDAIYSPRFRYKKSEIHENDGGGPNGDSRVVKPSRMGVMFGDQQNKIIEKEKSNVHRPSMNEALPKTTDIVRSWQTRNNRSQTTTDSVEEIWKERGFEKIEEIERIETMLESRILEELVEDVILELFHCCNNFSVTYRGSACRKRLYFY